ncbi:MAG: metallophosphoesterase family protein [Steroidobacteraceae bacterium]
MSEDLNARGDLNRRRALKCLMWGSAGVLWTLGGGVPIPFNLSSGTQGEARGAEMPAFTFGQISDSHIGFKAPANPDAPGTLAAAVAQISAGQPSFLIHTGDVSHLSKPEQFDTAAEIMKQSKREVFYVPGEHDTIGDDGKLFFERFGRAKGTGGWYSFDSHGVHFIGLVNVVGLKPGGLGTLGATQREWLEDDLRGRSASTPIVIFTHMPLWSIYPQWGWGTDDAAAALAYVKRFGSVTVLNGHIHQVIQKVEGNVTYRTAYSTAFPQPTPGNGAAPGPLAVPAGELRTMLGVRQVEVVADHVELADATLEDRGAR